VRKRPLGSVQKGRTHPYKKFVMRGEESKKFSQTQDIIMRFDGSENEKV